MDEAGDGDGFVEAAVAVAGLEVEQHHEPQRHGVACASHAPQRRGGHLAQDARDLAGITPVGTHRRNVETVEGLDLAQEEVGALSLGRAPPAGPVGGLELLDGVAQGVVVDADDLCAQLLGPDPLQGGVRQRQDGAGDVVDGVVAGEAVSFRQGLAVAGQVRVDLLQVRDGGAQVAGEAGSGTRDPHGNEQLGCGAPLEVCVLRPVGLRLCPRRRSVQRGTSLLAAHRG